MSWKLKVTAAISAAVVVAAGLVGFDTASATQDRDTLQQKRAARTTDACVVYGSGPCIGTAWHGYANGIDGDPATADVLVAGDSIVTMCRDELRPRLTSRGISVVFDYWSGRPTTDAVNRVLSYTRIHQPDTFDLVVMATGTNDLTNPPVMAGQIARMGGIESPVMWGSIYAARQNTYSPDLRNTGYVNAAIYQSGHPIVDWFAFLAASPAFRIGNYVSSDGVHPDEDGCDAWSELYAQRIDAEVS